MVVVGVVSGVVLVVVVGVVRGVVLVVPVGTGMLLQSPQTHVSTGSKCPYLVQVP